MSTARFLQHTARITGCFALATAIACGNAAPADQRTAATDRSTGNVPAADTFTVMAYNIHHGEGMDSVVDLERLAALIRDQDPDLVAIQEVDSSTERTGRVDQTARLAELTGLHAAFGAFMPYQGGGYGMAVLSRWPILNVRNLRLPDGAEPRTALAIRVREPASGRELEFVGIHFYRTEEERLAQAMTLLEVLAADTVPIILAGDFNSEPGGAVMDTLARSFHVLDKGADNLTFSSYDPVREIDFFLVRPADRFEVISHDVLDEPVASDHRPLTARLILNRTP